MAISTYKEPWVKGCLHARDGPLQRVFVKPETGWKLVSGVDDMSGEEELADVLGRPHSSEKTSLRRLDVNLGHLETNVLIRHLQVAHATHQALEAARNFEFLSCEAAEHLRVARQSSPCEVQPPLKSIAMEDWIPGERVKNLHMWAVKGAQCTIWRR